AKELGYPHELWTTRLLAAHARQHGPSTGHPSLAKLAQGTVCKILAEHEVKPHKVRYYLDQRDPEFEPKMAEILCVYRHVAMLRAEPGQKAKTRRLGAALPVPLHTGTRGPRRSARPRRIARRCLAPARP